MTNTNEMKNASRFLNEEEEDIMTEYDYSDFEAMSVHDTLKGIVTSTSYYGVYIMLENGENAFSYFGTVMPGDEVLCSVYRIAENERLTLVDIDSVMLSDNERESCRIRPVQDSSFSARIVEYSASAVSDRESDHFDLAV